MFSDEPIKNVAVFSGSSNGDGSYLELAEDLGKRLVLDGFTVVNGGGPGLMDVVAKAAFEQHGKVIGIHFEHESRTPSKYNTETISYKELAPRQQKVISLAQAFIVLPGGLGTLYEFIEILAKKHLQELDSQIPIILYPREFWKPLTSMMVSQKEKGFLSEKTLESFKVAASVDEILLELNKHVAEIDQISKQRERWNKRASDWDEETKSREHYANFESGYQKFLEFEKNVLSKVSIVETAIDLGCGSGQTTTLLVEKAKQIYILDVAEEMLKEAQNKVPNAVPLHASVTLVPLPGQSIDIAVSRGIVVSHLPKTMTDKFFDELKRIVRQNGKVIFDYMSNPHSADYSNESPKIPFTMEEITQALVTRGFGNIVFDGDSKDRVVRVSADKL